MTDRPRLLVLAPRFPYPPLAGGTQILLNILRALDGWDLTLLSFCASSEEMAFVPSDGLFRDIHKVPLPKWKSVRNVLVALPSRTPLQIAYYCSAEFRTKVDELLPRHDIVLAHLIRTGQYVQGAHIRRPGVLLMSDAISMAYDSMARVGGASALWSGLYRVERKRLFDYEQAAPGWFNQTWLHSDVDRKFLGLPSDRVRIVTLGINLDEFPFRATAAGHVVAFIGNMSFALNLDACLHFLRTIFPQVRKERDLRFRVIGVCPPAVKKKLLEFPGVEVTGRVERIADAVDGAFCGICPVRGGSGIQNKILNYMALGLPCVTSPTGLEGLDATPGSDLFVYKNEAEAARLIVRLYDDANLRHAMAISAREYVERAHDMKEIQKTVRAEMAAVLASGASTAPRTF